MPAHPYRTTAKQTVKQVIDEKMKILREFYVVDDDNQAEIRQLLQDAVDAQPNSDYEYALQRLTHAMVMEKLNT